MKFENSNLVLNYSKIIGLSYGYMDAGGSFHLIAAKASVAAAAVKAPDLPASGLWPSFVLLGWIRHTKNQNAYKIQLEYNRNGGRGIVKNLGRKFF
jgi:hypothetical protein